MTSATQAASRRPISVEEFEAFSALFGGNAVFVEELYAKYLENPASVDASWREMFRELHDDARTAQANLTKGSWAEHQLKIIGARDPEDAAKTANSNKKGPAATEEVLKQVSFESVRALMLIRAYRVRGHFHANLDPLNLEERKPHPELDPATYGFSDDDWDKEIYTHGVLGRQKATLREIMEILNRTYCGTIGLEFMHIQSPEQKAWIQSRFEDAIAEPRVTTEEKKTTLKELIEVESFENFLQLKFPSMKRFSVQGGDPMVPGVEMAIRTAAQLGIEDINIGMPHRGRMNVLTTVMKKPFLELFSLFHGNLDYPEGVASSGDVKYHLGTSTDRNFGDKKVHMTLAANPSHLEAVDPVVLGRVRAKQDLKGDTERTRCMGIIMHGDAAFAGQGIVAEVLSLSQLDAYKTGGTLHVIVNNQIGFTTNPKSGRSSPYSTDVAKMVGAPIFHVNGDDPEAVVYACKLATQYLIEFRADVIVDIICYRKYGHNESDEPMFTQPRMYKEIRRHTLPATLYGQRLIAEGTVTQADVDGMFEQYRERFDKEFEDARTFRPNAADWLQGQWSGFTRPEGEHPDVDTGVEPKLLKEVGLALAQHPEGYEINPKILRQLDSKKEMITSGENIDWALGEALAFGTLLKQGYPVRLTGQDVERGTFSHRHAVLTDQTDERKYIPLNNLGDKQADFIVYNSNLSEFAVLGFEYGYSQASPNTLTLWEAQFGDFVNGAQVIIDQFISSAEMKWLRMSGLVMLLPHGYEGQGPEHSSARLERFLQLCAQDNMQVANCTTPANYYHILRRQLLRNFRKPLIMMSPKSLLRHRLCTSSLKDFAKGTSFQPVIGEIDKLKSKIRKVILTSGKVYYDLLETRREQKIDDVAILRLEQYYPFPARKLAEALKPYTDAELVWCQEEPRNMGAWTFVSPFIEEVLEQMKAKQTRPGYVGRPAAASPACGYLKLHNQEQQALVAEALGK
jgi:2-oxoglutarate dehydrogenase E1 component